MQIPHEKWIWEHHKYPDFPYDKKEILQKIDKIIYLKGKLDGILSFIGQKELNEIEINTITEEIMTTSQIEGEYLRRESVRDSVAKVIDVHYKSYEDYSTRQTDALTELMMDCYRNHTHLSVDRLHAWHNALFAHTRGHSDGINKIEIATFRTYDEMKVIENQFGREGQRVKYIAPPAHTIKKDIDALIAYCNSSDESPYIKSAIAHLWFVSIHPYDDGNGRISRAIADYILSHETQEQYKAYSISTAIYKKRGEYYNTLDETTNLFKNRQYDFTKWIAWHLQMFTTALETSLEKITFIMQKTKFWDRHRYHKLNNRQVSVLEKLIGSHAKGYSTEISTKGYREMTGAVQVTASRDIKKLVEIGCLSKVEGKGGRSVSYYLVFE